MEEKGFNDETTKDTNERLRKENKKLKQDIKDHKACIHDIHDEYCARLFKKQMMLVGPALIIAITLMLCFGK